MTSPKIVRVRSTSSLTIRAELDPKTIPVVPLVVEKRGFRPSQLMLVVMFDETGGLVEGTLRAYHGAAGVSWRSGDPGVPDWARQVMSLLVYWLPVGVTVQALRDLFSGPDTRGGHPAPASVSGPPGDGPRGAHDHTRPDHRPTPHTER